MADTKISALAALTGAGSASGDKIPIDDVSATTTKSITVAELLIALGAAGASVTAPFGVGSVELGHASDTTIARESAGLVTVEGIRVALVTSLETADTTTAYTLVLTDAGKMVSLSNAGGITLTIPANASVAFPIGTRIDLVQKGAGQVTVSPTGITLVSASTKRKLTGQYSGATLWKQATDTWYLFGDIAT